MITICTETAEMMSPVRRISGPSRWVRSSARLIGREKSITTKFTSIASVSAEAVRASPYSAVPEIAAAMVPGPAMSGAASGTSERSVKFSRRLCSCFCTKRPSRTAVQPIMKRINPPVMRSE